MTSLFLHAGLLHLLSTLLVQLYLMRDMEKLCGPARMAIIYLGSGMAGNLASAIFIPSRGCLMFIFHCCLHFLKPLALVD